MGILKRLFQVLHWLALLPLLLGLFLLLAIPIVILLVPGERMEDETPLVPGICILPYIIIVVIRWILFKEWIFFPWQKGATKEDI